MRFCVQYIPFPKSPAWLPVHMGIIPSGCRIWLEKTLALYQGMAFSHAAHC
jgi:hypothetical protein